MTPHEKAKELVDKFFKYSYWDSDYVSFKERVETRTDHAKQCALIAVDEIIKTEEPVNHVFTGLTSYWQKVKEELENL